MEASVTAIIPCYRCSDTVARAIDSVAAQTLRPAEVILVDDGSEDNTLEKLLQIQGAYGEGWIKVIPLERNRGVSMARNVAWDAALHDYVAFLDADDAWHPEKIALQYLWMHNNPETPVSGHKCVMVDPGARVTVSKVDSDFAVRYVSRRQLLVSNPFVTPSFMLRRNLEYRFDPSRRYTEDFLLLMQLGLDGYRIAMLEVELAYVFKRLGKSGASRHLLRMRHGDTKNYWQLWRSGRLGFMTVSALTAYSILKFIALLTLGPSSHSALKRLVEWWWSRRRVPTARSHGA